MENGKVTFTENLRKIFPRTYWDVGKVMGGTLSRNLLRGVLKLLVAGFLTPQAMGIFRSIYSFYAMVGSFAEFGFDYAVVTFVAAALGKGDTREKNQILQIVFSIKIITISTFMIIGNLWAENITLFALSDASLTIYVRLVFFTIGGHLLWQFIYSYFSAHQDFSKMALYLATMPMLMLITTIVLILFGSFSLPACISIYLLAPAVTAIIWWPVLDREFLKYHAWDTTLFKTIIRFSRWIYVTNLASSIRNHINPLFLKNIHLSGSLSAGETNAGLYSFGNDLANEITVFSESLLTVLLPKASSISDPIELKRFIKQSYKHLVFLLIPLSLLIFAAKPMIHILAFFKAGYLAYLPSYPIFMILYAGTLLSLATLPMMTALYALRLPQIEAYIELVMGGILIGGGIWLIPRYGSYGAALAVLIQRFIFFLGICGYGAFKLKKLGSEVA